MSIDPKARALAAEAAELLRRGYDPDELFGTLIPVLVALAIEYLGRDVVLAELEGAIAALKRGDA